MKEIEPLYKEPMKEIESLYKEHSSSLVYNYPLINFEYEGFSRLLYWILFEKEKDTFLLFSWRRYRRIPRKSKRESLNPRSSCRPRLLKGEMSRLWLTVDGASRREKWAAYGSLLLPQREPPMAPFSWHKENIGCDNDPLGSLYIHNLSELRLESEGHEPTSERSPSEAGHHCHQDPEHTWHLGIITVITSWHRTQAWTLLADVLLTKT